MEITWFGHSCFRLTQRSMASVVTDPYDHSTIGYSPLRLKADIVTVSHDAPGHNNVSVVKSKPRLISGPGEYEIGNVFITGVRVNARGTHSSENVRNTIYVFDYDGVTVAHLGDLSSVPSQTDIEALGSVNIALVPVGGGGGLTAAKAAEMVSLVEPGIVVPMHYQTPACNLDLDPLDKFLKEMGLGEVDPVPSLKATSSSIPNEINVIVLDYQH